MLKRTCISHAKPRVVVVGTGWGGAYFARGLNTENCTLQVLSRRNHMVFTPMLPQTTTGTLEFRSICEPIMRIQRGLSKKPSRYTRCLVYGIDFEKREVHCVGVGVVGASANVPARTFSVPYDKLVLAHGASPNTFNIPGVNTHAFFLREVYEARAIRKRVVQNIMAADLPITPPEEVKRLLHTVVVGGGPTGIEFAANLADYFNQEIRRINPDLLPHCRVTILEAGEVFGLFDEQLRKWGQGKLKALGVKVVKGAVVGVTENQVLAKDGTVIPTGLVVWSTGVGPTSFTKDMDVDKTSRGRIAVDDYMRVLKDGKPIPDVYAVGDCAANTTTALPTLAAVASRHGSYLAKEINASLEGKTYTTPFVYKSLGSMVSIGDRAAVIELHKDEKKHFDLVGLRALYFWRSAYLTMLGSWRSKMYVAVNWIGSRVFGRDITFIGDLEEDRTWDTLAREEVSRARNRDKVAAAEKEASAQHSAQPASEPKK